MQSSQGSTGQEVADGSSRPHPMRANLLLVWGNPNVRRVQLAFLGAEAGVWIYLIALLVFSYGVGGAALVGVFAGTRLLCSALSMPVGGAVADRMSRRDYLIVCNVLRFPLLALAALGIIFELGTWVVLVPGILLTMLAVTFRPAQAGLLPNLVTEPHELTAANATAETIQATTNFIGPAIGGLLVGLFGPAPVVLISALGSIWAIALLLRVPRDAPTESTAPAARADAGPRADDPDDGTVGDLGGGANVGTRLADPPAGESTSLMDDVLGGFGAIRRDRDLAVVTGFYLVGGTLLGVYMVVLVVIAGEWLGNPAAVGWMNGLSGAGAIVGGIAVLARADRARLARLTLIGCLGSCLGLVALGSVPHVAMIAVVMLAMGLVEPPLQIGLGTIPQRLVPGRFTARVVAATSAIGVLAAAFGAFVSPVLIDLLGLRETLVVGGLVGSALMLGLGTQVPRIDRRLTSPRGLELLGQVPMFAPLSPVLLEQIVQRLKPVEVVAGSDVIREGEAADHIYLIESGAVRVTKEGRELRIQGAGEVFGEIGCLRALPRTATVTALQDLVLLALPRDEFLAVLAGDPRVLALADDLVQRRLTG